MDFIEPMHRNKPNITYLLTYLLTSLGQLNLEPTRPNSFVGCKVPTDLVKIGVKEATHMGFHYKVTRLKKSSILTQIGGFWTVTPV